MPLWQLLNRQGTQDLNPDTGACEKENWHFLQNLEVLTDFWQGHPAPPHHIVKCRYLRQRLVYAIAFIGVCSDFDTSADVMLIGWG